MLTTALNEIKSHDPCASGWDTLLSGLNKTVGDDEPLTFEYILESNGFDDALWACRVLTGDGMKRFKLLICDYAERALVHVPDGEERPRIAIETARKFLNGDATREELDAARAAAVDYATRAADFAARATVAAVAAVADAARATVAAVAAVAAVARSADDADYAAHAVARADELEIQITMFKEFIS